MSRRKTSSVGAFHPILFFVVIYGISLFLAFFVCSSVYYSINDKKEEVSNQTASSQQYELDNTTTVTALR